MYGGCRIYCIAACTLVISHPCTADIYASYSADGTPQYSTSPFRRSQVPILRDPHRAPDTSVDVRRSSPPRTYVEISSIISDTCIRHGVDPSLVKAVIEVESGFRARSLSPKGAMGVMQLMPDTARQFGARDPFDPAQNIDAGVQYLKMLLAQHNGNLALALSAYNAGVGAVRRNGKRIPPYQETMDFVPTVLARYVWYQQHEGN
ncbi:hypothetical protein BKK79_02090 [Cupriavidus sp. USMAA2-4]|uniref:lytic transglycosylase domain-containing protein n=1 Tax=Cupriavidus sp. USMAA2-4 TaxID=876364 RepID=UPI0008A68950|nr:lytic transglycosylase domain-containing protein [Cupriavidus sp. USMAA2-4]AOY90739.1 hypothetical protein BKK79_02090 [Cupriavidus sp. USMAA2-4]